MTSNKNYHKSKIKCKWVYCNSKSHPGHSYYFNTVTGKSIWNIGDSEEAEINSEDVMQININASNYPEPKDNPPSNLSHQNLRNCVNMCNSISSMNSHTLNINPTAFNPNIWPVPQTIVVAPAITPFNHLFQQLPQSNINNFNTLPQYAGDLYTGNETFTPLPSIHLQQENIRANNIRNKQSPKKKKKFYHKNNHQRILGEQNVGERESWMTKKDSDDNSDNAPLDEEIILDINCLKLLGPPDANPDCWFIVTDTDMLLRNYSFIDNLISQDESCSLYLLQGVLNDLESLAQFSDINARRILRFLKEQINNGDVTIATQENNYNEDMISTLLQNCSMLHDQRYHVVLLSDNQEFLSRQQSVEFYIFCMKDLKKRLKSNHKFGRTINKLHRYNKSSIDSNKKRNETATNATFALDSFTDFKNDSEIQNVDNSSHAESATEGPNELLNPIKVSNDVNVNRKKVEIKLKRSSPFSSDTSNRTNKTKFGWRKKKAMGSLSPHNNKIIKNVDFSDEQQKKDRNVYSPKLIPVNEEEKAHNEDPKCINSSSSPCIILPKNDSVASITVNETFSSVNSNMSGAASKTSCINNTPKDHEINLHGELDHKRMTFEVVDSMMEENLKRKCDEWVLRFVQIMEEVLTQVLQREPKFESTNSPPPWSLQQAALCIITKYLGHCKVVDAANQFYSVIRGLSDTKGSLHKNMTPTQFMKMYSYGVYLVKALQDAIDRFEDLNTAAGSLQTLLSDIQNPNMDNSSNSIFPSEIHDEPIVDNSKIEVNKPSTSQVQDEYSGSNKTHTLPIIKRTVHNNLTVQNTTKSPTGTIKIQEQKREGSANFFSSLELIEKPNIKPYHKDSCFLKDNSFENNDKLSVENVVNTPAKITRTFKKVSEFEKRINEKATLPFEGNEYEEMFDEGNYGSENVYNCIDYDNNSFAENVDCFPQYENPIDNLRKDDINIDTENEISNVDKFKIIIHMIIKDTKEKLFEIKKIREENKMHDQDQKLQLKALLKYVHDITESLTSLFPEKALKDDESEKTNLIATYMDKFGVSLKMDDNTRAQYRKNVSNMITAVLAEINYER